jgi:rubrerythrin
MLKLKLNEPFAILTAMLVLPLAAAQTPEQTKTLDNLLEAYKGEISAKARYLAFAKKADEQDYGKVASLFRAAARAEEIHANNHAEVIRKLGGDPSKIDPAKPEVKSTRENLEAAIKGETYERDKMYPEFIAQARSDRVRQAVRSFNYAKRAEAEHAKLYRQALENLDEWKGGKKDFFVCSVCGYTVEKIGFEECPSCSSPKEKYEKVN